MLDALEKLCTLAGVSGREEHVRAFISDAVRPYADKVFEDSLGNLIVFVKGKKRRKKRLMAAAHMDEVGLYIKEITDDGYLKLAFAGGVDRRVILGKRVLVGDKKIPGIVGLKAVHLTTKEERKATPKLSELGIDIGCDTRAQAEKLVALGEYAVFDSAFRHFADTRIKARALDDRFGCAVLLTLISEPLMYDTWFAFTVMEEVGCRGAKTAAYAMRPDTALVLEATTAADIPSADGAARVCTLGGGAVLGCMDGGTIYDKELFARLRAIAEEDGVPWQIKTRVAGGTDAASIQRSNDGVRTTLLALPCRYIHSPSCVADTRDMDAVLALARTFINCEECALNV